MGIGRGIGTGPCTRIRAAGFGGGDRLHTLFLLRRVMGPRESVDCCGNVGGSAGRESDCVAWVASASERARGACPSAPFRASCRCRRRLHSHIFMLMHVVVDYVKKPGWVDNCGAPQRLRLLSLARNGSAAWGGTFLFEKPGNICLLF